MTLSPRLTASLLLLLILALTPATAFSVSMTVDASLANATTGNIYGDSSSLWDTYSLASVSVDIFPVSFAKINLRREHMAYREISSLSNFVSSGGITIVPTSGSSDLSLLFSGNFSTRRYSGGSATEAAGPSQFSGSDFDALISGGYQVTRALHLRAGLSYKSIGYGEVSIPLDESGPGGPSLNIASAPKFGFGEVLNYQAFPRISDKYEYALFVGGNASLPGTHALDLEAGLGTGNFDYLLYDINDLDSSILADEAYSRLDETVLKSFYLSARLSRPLGSKTGLSLTVSKKRFRNYVDQASVFGLTSGYISPWASLYSGNLMQFSVQSYLVPKLIVSFGGGYWEKDYPLTLEGVYEDTRLGPVLVVRPRLTVERTDNRRQIFAAIKWPLIRESGALVEPSFRVDYTNNHSTIGVYDYDDLSFTVAIRVKL